MSFQYLEPDKFVWLSRQVENHVLERQEHLNKSIEQLEERLGLERLKFSIQGRVKHLYSIYKKMGRDGKTVSQIYDLMAKGHRQASR
ncbi:MAG: hypothetical protein R2865_05655 [Deinococcales bacterium]